MVRRNDDETGVAADPRSFRCQGFVRDAFIRRANGEALPIQELPPFLRALLVTDGTVTKSLEAYFWEPVKVVTLQQDFVYAERPIEWIGVEPGDQVLIRRARLSGVDTTNLYATAYSVIRPAFIPRSFRQRLVDREIGIGVLIRDSGLESYREVLDVGLEPTSVSEDENVPECSELVFRTYRIFIDGKPVILITESFPIALYE